MITVQYTPQLELPDVTLVSIDTVCYDLTKLAIEECTKRVTFGDVKIFNTTGGGDVIKIDDFSNLEEAGNFTVYKLPDYIKTKFCLFIHWDSWVIDTGMWRNEFLAYDYIGAPWWYKDGYNVGNSGFTIRSLALMKFMAANKKDFPLTMPEDVVLCRQYRPQLTQFKWAPESVAQDFAFERTRPAVDSRHFGFHGVFNWPFVLTIDALAERMELARRNPYIQKSGMLSELDAIGKGHWMKLLSGVHTSSMEEVCDAAE